MTDSVKIKLTRCPSCNGAAQPHGVRLLRLLRFPRRLRLSARHPAACPPRVGDPSYREKYVEHSARWVTEGAFDAQWMKASDRQTAAMKALQWVPGGKMGVTCRPDTFWALYDTVVEMNVANRSLAERTGFEAFNPDPGSPVTDLIALSMFVQGWLPYLNQPEIDEVMKRSGLASQYVEPTPLNGLSAPCGGCKAEVTAPTGSKRCVCNGCGHLLRAEAAVPCGNCGASMLMPAERTTFQCPFCDTELRTMAWTANQVEPR